nr:MAG TPA: hypothetical protein [Caudoviricetes sp.]
MLYLVINFNFFLHLLSCQILFFIFLFIIFTPESHYDFNTKYNSCPYIHNIFIFSFLRVQPIIIINCSFYLILFTIQATTVFTHNSS